MDSRRARTAQRILDGKLGSPTVFADGCVRSLVGGGLIGPSHKVRVEPIDRSCEQTHCLDAPDLIEPVTAFHSWRVIDGELCSAHQPFFSHDPALKRFGFGGGAYAYLEPDCDLPKVDHRAVSGVVTLWGLIEVYDGGMRAEQAEVAALAPYSRSSDRLKKAVWSIADELGIDVIELDEIEAAVNNYGSPLPAALRA